LKRAVVLDVSMSGLRVLAPTAPELRVGTTVGIEVDGLFGSVTIRRVVNSDDPGQRIYGVEFIDPAAHMARQVHYRLVGRVENGSDLLGPLDSIAPK
jgi:hypothetical protein